MSTTPKTADEAFAQKYGHAPVKAQSTAKGSRAELESLRQFKAANQKKIIDAAITTANKPTVTQPVTVAKKLSAYDRALHEAKLTHDAVQQLRADAGLSKMNFDQALFESKFANMNATQRPSQQTQSQADALQAAMNVEAQKRGQTLAPNTYKTPKQLAEETRSLSPAEQRAALNAAILAELKKL